MIEFNFFTYSCPALLTRFVEEAIFTPFYAPALFVEHWCVKAQKQSYNSLHGQKAFMKTLAGKSQTFHAATSSQTCPLKHGHKGKNKQMGPHQNKKLLQG